MNKYSKFFCGLVLLFCLFGCSKIENNDNNNDIKLLKSGTISESLTPFTDIQNKYIDLALEYEFGKTGNSTNIQTLSLEEKIEMMSAFVDATETTVETNADFLFYGELYEQLITEINNHPIVAEYIINASQIYGETDPMSMMLSSGGCMTISKMEILQNFEDSVIQETTHRKLARYTAHLKWPNAIKYRVGKKVTSYMLIQLQIAMNDWRAATNNKISFSRIDNSTKNQLAWALCINNHLYVDITNGSPYAKLGHVPYSCIHLPANVDTGTCRHEMGHVLGLIHEHQRHDRDNYVNIYLSNAKIGHDANFWKIPSGLHKTYGAFDFNSIMLYHSWSFGKPTSTYPYQMVTISKKGGSTFWDPQTLSSTDIAKIKEIYY